MKKTVLPISLLCFVFLFFVCPSEASDEAALAATMGNSLISVFKPERAAVRIRKEAPEAWIEINPVDAKKLEVSNGDRIDISSIRGRINDIIVKESQNIRPGSIFVPFHYNEQLINTITKAEFDPKSFEPNYKQCAVQLHSIKVPNGIVLKENEIAGALEHIVLKQEIPLFKEALKTARIED